ncbi:hypothetical protein GOP47_0001927 [Adiantum capillus-veneris]|uniref:Uncharacterized protein n=1 Tax=Adiantum capillus-veneris TaxID=13818 RepID=A0A9D4V9C8_ADICA|nr:hypothetical protein GOP47_0001927 [Adiantum capillus-veneris]
MPTKLVLLQMPDTLPTISIDDASHSIIRINPKGRVMELLLGNSPSSTTLLRVGDRHRCQIELKNGRGLSLLLQPDETGNNGTIIDWDFSKNQRVNYLSPTLSYLISSSCIDSTQGISECSTCFSNFLEGTIAWTFIVITIHHVFQLIMNISECSDLLNENFIFRGVGVTTRGLFYGISFSTKKTRDPSFSYA